ncbi:DUF2271 domain-containing protein [Pacificimonas flava]|uniref:Putative exported protein n=1 Tax=Pacificimonas flava TaxID=1234595 RepID=M2T8Q0_9SPHN|nr:DUF2271 domain-containing protein [Pacificimonas flava]EMD82859.1 putative exported protein [Pacificimonas flava]MBB5279473.1 hypothetical protein [Pacificimonas flava]
MKSVFFTAIGSLAAVPAAAAGLEVSVEIPRLSVAEYHRPYVAMWIEDDARRTAANLSVWYDTGMAREEGEKWLADLRTWWRRSGRSLDMPVDGVSGPTKAPGTHSAEHRGDRQPLRTLKPGTYRLVVEAAREVGGRETVTIPFVWPPRRGETLSADGKSELGGVRLTLKP